uniref:Uncharacterized protein n=1 Tax=Anguilla anguilla TaxID=7936 RepID=A0A0E9QLV1_ANGAN
MSRLHFQPTVGLPGIWVIGLLSYAIPVVQDA